MFRPRWSERPGLNGWHLPRIENWLLADGIRATPKSVGPPRPRPGKWQASHRRVEQQLSRRGATSGNQGWPAKVERIEQAQQPSVSLGWLRRRRSDVTIAEESGAEISVAA